MGVWAFWPALIQLFGVIALRGVADFFLIIPTGSGAAEEVVLGVPVEDLFGVGCLSAFRFSHASLAEAFPMPAEIF